MNKKQLIICGLMSIAILLSIFVFSLGKTNAAVIKQNFFKVIVSPPHRYLLNGITQEFKAWIVVKDGSLNGNYRPVLPEEVQNVQWTWHHYLYYPTPGISNSDPEHPEIIPMPQYNIRPFLDDYGPSGSTTFFPTAVGGQWEVLRFFDLPFLPSPPTIPLPASGGAGNSYIQPLIHSTKVLNISDENNDTYSTLTYTPDWPSDAPWYDLGFQAEVNFSSGFRSESLISSQVGIQVGSSNTCDDVNFFKEVSPKDSAVTAGDTQTYNFAVGYEFDNQGNKVQLNIEGGVNWDLSLPASYFDTNVTKCVDDDNCTKIYVKPVNNSDVYDVGVTAGINFSMVNCRIDNIVWGPSGGQIRYAPETSLPM